VYLTGFRNDVFISYSHVDNEPDRPDLDGEQGRLGWVDRFMRRFEPALWKEVGARAVIWFDLEDVADNHRFDRHIEDATRGSAVLLALVTNAYLQADYCTTEREWFVDSATRSPVGLNVENRSRIHPVRVFDIPHPRWPTVLRGVSGSKFFNNSGQPMDPLHDDASFTEAVGRLALHVGALLKSLKDREPTEPEPLPVNTFKICLAATSDTSARQKRRLAAALMPPEFEVVGSQRPIPPPFERDKHSQELTKLLDTADLAVHLLDGYPGQSIPESEDAYFPEEQCRIGLTHPCSQLVILPEYLDPETIEEKPYRKFLEDLEKGSIRAAAGQEGTRTLTVARARSDESILALIRDLKQKREQAQRAHTEAEGGSIFIDLDSRDLRSITDFYEFLSSRQYSAVTMSTSDRTPSENTRLFEQNLLGAEAFVIIYGQARREWVKSRLELAVKLILRHELPIRPVVYVAPPAKLPAELNFSFCQVVNGTAGFDAGAVAGLLNNRPSMP